MMDIDDIAARRRQRTIQDVVIRAQSVLAKAERAAVDAVDDIFRRTYGDAGLARIGGTIAKRADRRGISRVEFAAAMLRQFNAKQREEFEAQRLRDAARSHGQTYPH
jgi:hypothetical protein